MNSIVDLLSVTVHLGFTEESIGIGLAVQTATRSFTCSLSVLYVSDFVSLDTIDIAWYVLGLIFRV